MRELKKGKAPPTEIKAAVAELVARKQTLSDLVRRLETANGGLETPGSGDLGCWW